MVNVQVANRVSVPQIEFLAQCMEQFPTLALANFGKSREETSCAHKKWVQIGSALNKIKPGVTKTGLGWLRYWTNYKYQLRKRYPQFKQSWVSEGPVRVTPLERRFLQVLSEHEKNQPPHVLFQGDQNAESYPIGDEEEKGLTPKCPQQETSQSPPTKQELFQPMPVMQEMAQPMPTMQVIDVHRERKLESSQVADDYTQDDDDDDKNSTEDTFDTENETKKIKSIQVEILKFNLKRQKEMHDLQMAQMKERHKLEIEILQLKKIRLMQDCDRIRKEI